MSDKPSHLDRIISACFGVLAGAVAMYVAVRLIEAVWTALLVILGAASFMAISVAVLRNRRNDW